MAPSQTLANVFTKADATRFGTTIGSLRRTPPHRPTSHPRKQDRRMMYPTLGITKGSVSHALKAALYLTKVDETCPEFPLGTREELYFPSNIWPMSDSLY
ncbi:unnamed protein product [Prunus armeniaca]